MKRRAKLTVNKETLADLSSGGPSPVTTITVQYPAASPTCNSMLDPHTCTQSCYC